MGSGFRASRLWVKGGLYNPDPLKEEPAKMNLITTLGKLGEYWEVPFVGSSRWFGSISTCRGLESMV